MMIFVTNVASEEQEALPMTDWDEPINAKTKRKTGTKTDFSGQREVGAGAGEQEALPMTDWDEPINAKTKRKTDGEQTSLPVPSWSNHDD